MKYYYYKTINNNAIVCTDENKNEAIILGKAIGVDPSRYIGKLISKDKIERIFTTNNEYIEPLIKDIPYSYYDLVQEIIEYASEKLNYDFKDSLFLTLLDHIVFAERRYLKREIIANPLLTEIKMFESDKFEVAEAVVRKLNTELKVSFDENESGFIAFHFVNAMSDFTLAENKNIMKMQKKVVDFISSLDITDVDVNSFYFSRLVLHIKYLITRLLGKKVPITEGIDKAFIHMVNEKYTKEWNVAIDICNYIENQFSLKTTDNDKVYITMHMLPLMKTKG